MEAMRVYKYLPAKFALAALKDQRLKVSTLADLNDPFDLRPIDTTNPRNRDAWAAALAPFREEKRGLICLSRGWDGLLLWGHYGDSHKGACLAFDVLPHRDGHFTKVDYQKRRLTIPTESTEDFVRRVLSTKHTCWQYEKEVRGFVKLDDPPKVIKGKRLHFVDFKDSSLISLKEVVLGSECDSQKREDLVKAAARIRTGLKCYQARPLRDRFGLDRVDVTL